MVRRSEGSGPGEASPFRSSVICGLMAGMSSPARPWHRLALDDEDLMEYPAVKHWLEAALRQQRNIFARSNTYRALGQVYDVLGAFGTAPMFILDDYDDVINCQPISTGEYWIAADDRNQPVLFMRDFEMTVGQLYSQFGEENCSRNVRNLYRNGMGVNTWIPVMHVVQPRTWSDRQGRHGAKGMPWSSVYFELDGPDDKLLAERGYKRFPIVCPRWAVEGSSPYGISPGAEALGYVEQLQHHQRRKGQAIDYGVRPPLQAPTSMANNPKALLPGGISYVDSPQPGGGIRSAWDVRLDLNALVLDIKELRSVIERAFYTDLFLMLTREDRSNVTAHEIAARHEEKLLMLGPVLERQHSECLRALIETTFERQLEAGILPPPPPELRDREISVEFVSMLAQAQRAIGTQGVDRLVVFARGLGEAQAATGAYPSAMRRIDALAAVGTYAEMLGVDPRLLRPSDEVVEEQRAAEEAAAQAQQAQQAQLAVATAKDAGEAVPQEGSVLAEAMAGVSGYATPGVL